MSINYICRWFYDVKFLFFLGFFGQFRFLWIMKSIMPLWLSYLRYQVSHGDKHKDNNVTGHHSVHLLSQEVQKEGKKCNGGWVTELNKGWEPSEVHPVQVPSSCLRFAFREAVWFPLASSRTDMFALRPGDCGVARWESLLNSIFWFLFFFLKKEPWSSFRIIITYSLVRCQSRGGRRGKFLATAEGGAGRGGSSLYFHVLLILVVKKTVCSMVILHSFEEL